MTGILNMLLGVAAGALPFSITAAQHGTLNPGSIGVDTSVPYGTINSGGTFQSGKSLQAIGDGYVSGGRTSAFFAVGSLSADPTQASLVSVTCNGVTFTGASASGYNYAAGRATWSWTTTSGFGLANATGYSGSISKATSAW